MSKYVKLEVNKQKNTSTITTEQHFNEIGRDKGLSKSECKYAFIKYTEICGNRWDFETAIECITDIT